MDDAEMRVYSSIFTKEIKIFSREDARYVILHFCEYCNKGAINAFHCGGADAMRCQAVKKQIVADWFPRKAKKCKK